MAASITQFSNLTNPTGPELDNTFLAYAVFGMIPCTVSGTNNLTLALNSNTPALTQLTQGIQFSGVFAGGNTGAMTAIVGTFPALNVYKDSPAGPIVLSGGEGVTGNAFSLRYDSVLNSGAGGYHITTNTGFSGGTISGSLANLTLLGGTLSVLGTSIGSSLTSNLLTGNSLTVSALLANFSLMNAQNGTVSSLQVGSLGATLATMTRMLSGLATVTFTVTPANTVQDQNFTLTGTAVRDVVALGLGSSVPSGAGFNGFCGTTGTITVRLLNPTAASISATTMTIRAMAMGLTP